MVGQSVGCVGRLGGWLIEELEIMTRTLLRPARLRGVGWSASWLLVLEDVENTKMSEESSMWTRRLRREHCCEL